MTNIYWELTMYQALNKKSVCVNSFNSRNNAMRQRVIGENTPFECEITGEVNGVNDSDCYWKGQSSEDTLRNRDSESLSNLPSITSLVKLQRSDTNLECLALMPMLLTTVYKDSFFFSFF